MRFCPNCGAPVISGARFCVECGVELTALDFQHAAPAPASQPSPEQRTAIAAFATVFGGLVAIGAAVTLLILHQLPAREALLSTVPPPPPAVQGSSEGNLPPGHPTIKLPKEARDLISRLEQKARAQPNDIAVWRHFGDVSARAAVFDQSYYAKADEAYAHVLKLNPDDLGALRGVGDIDFDQHKYDEAIAAYEHYLSKKPDDPRVRTDLGTMYLSTSNADQALIQYRRVLRTNPDFFEANFNSGVALTEMDELVAARAAYEKALKLAPNPDARQSVQQMLVALDNEGVPATGTASASSVVAQPSERAKSGFEGSMEAMLRGLPIAGSKVESLQWPSKRKVKVLMDNFPMDQMPPFAAAKFLDDLKAGIRRVKNDNKVSGPLEVDICDAASGRVMRSVTE